MTSHTVSIPEYYSGKNVFITGATGFMGKALMEKLLRSCPRIGTIYILIRPKKGKTMAERLQDLTKQSIYDRLKKEHPEIVLEKKLVPLAGDITELGLGLSVADRQLIVDTVQIIFHVAASVRFDDPLSDAVILNVRGTREVCQLALNTKHLQAHIHVSTAFANCDKPEAKEILYPPLADWRKLIEIAEKCDKHTLNVLTEKFMAGMPNTYCFTKNVAEHVVRDMCEGKIPSKIFRPSIVISTLNEEPVKGWIDNFNGPIGIMVAYGKGIMRTMYANEQYKPDYIAVDVATKALIVSAWDLALRHQNHQTEVIHCTSHNYAAWLRPTIEELAYRALDLTHEVPLNDVVWYPSNHTTTSTLVCYIRTVFTMLLPALLADGLLLLTGRRPRLTKLQKKMYTAQLALRHFMNNEWTYYNEQLLQLQKRVMAEDERDWSLEFAEANIVEYLRHGMLGCRTYLLKEPAHTLPDARKHIVRMYWLDKIVKLLLVLLFIWYLYTTDTAGFVLDHFARFAHFLLPIPMPVKNNLLSVP